nr:MAG TPA: hypothetical protein [Caudoviricetes sp.]
MTITITYYMSPITNGIQFLYFSIYFSNLLY